MRPAPACTASPSARERALAKAASLSCFQARYSALNRRPVVAGQFDPALMTTGPSPSQIATAVRTTMITMRRMT